MVGMPWRHIRDHAPALGVRIVSIGKKRGVIASELLAALVESRRGTDREKAILDSLGLSEITE
jgi:hypothetical protein